jgi:hypothetical protein
MFEWFMSPNLWFYQNMRRRKSSRRNWFIRLVRYLNKLKK